MKKWTLYFSLLTTLTGSALFADGEVSQQQNQNQMMSPPGQQQNQMAPEGNGYDCSSLSKAEQNFAMQLSVMNKKMFCSQFTSLQRQQAMQMASQPDAFGNKVTPNQAVQNTMSSSAPQRQKSTGGCPVK